jgi:hypothetical protein
MAVSKRLGRASVGLDLAVVILAQRFGTGGAERRLVCAL